MALPTRTRLQWPPGPLAACLAAGLAALHLVPSPLSAQQVSAQQDPDFLFGRPSVTVGLHGGWSMPSQSGEIFEFVRERLTVERGAFDGFTVGGEVSWRWTERVDVTASLEYASASVGSEFRDWVDQDDRPIEQTTDLSRLPLTVSVKGYLFERGREISRLAWIPTGWSPYVGGGAGILWYDFAQEGDFVDFETLDIFRDRFVSDGSTTTAHVLGGVQLSLSRRMVVRGEYRHSWASAELGGDFVGFEPMDLGGGRLTVGVAVRMSPSRGGIR